MIVIKNGDLLESGCNIICHQVNCQGVMGSGIARQIREKYRVCYERFLIDHENGGAVLGKVLFVRVGENTYIANMYSQFHYYPRTACHTNYDAFDSCCKEIANFADNLRKKDPSKHYKIGFPYNIGCGLAGGDWNMVRSILFENFLDPEYDVEIWRIQK